MRSLTYFICTPKDGVRYKHTQDIDGKGFITSSTDEDHTVVNRIAIVESLPIKYKGPIEAGDEIVVHHNIFRVYGDMKGRERSSYAHLFGDKFMIDPFDIYAYKRKGKWYAIAPYCFVAPIERTEEDMLNNSEYENNLGIMVYPNEEQRDIKPGTKVGYKAHIEYEFNIEGKKLYRMKTNSICLIKEGRY